MFNARTLVATGALLTTVTVAGLEHPTLVVAGENVGSLPLADQPYVVPDDLDLYREMTLSGGPPQDGIPSIDSPVFIPADEAELEAGDKVIGFEHGGVARAYPHDIMVHHEIVNDEVDGLNVAVTYCPLTATAQGFERGDTTLGVSGKLLNSNLVMFDRETESYFPQIVATGSEGQHEGSSLRELDLVWTTWERWRSVHPDTEVLSRETGHLRNYDRDPYGEYNPRGGYYAGNDVIFPLIHDSNAHHPKEMVVGARTSERSAYFVLDQLAEESVQRTGNFVAVYDPDLHRGVIYAADEEGPAVTPQGGREYEVDGETYDVEELPLERLASVEGFFFAWHAFYPDSETP